MCRRKRAQEKAQETEMQRPNCSHTQEFHTNTKLDAIINKIKNIKIIKQINNSPDTTL